MSGFLRSVLSIAMVVCLVVGVGGQQVAGPNSARPSFEAAKGPVVAIDEAHRNTHTIATASLRDLVSLLQGDGYRVRPLADALTPASLAGIDVLLLSGPGGWVGGNASIDEREVATLMDWLRRGGAMLLLLDHMPAPANAARLTAALGVRNWHNGYAMVGGPDASFVGNIIFWRSDSFPPRAPAIGPTGPGGGTGYQGADAVLAKHPVTEGRGEAERVRRVATFVGSAFQAPPGAEPLLTMPRRAVSLTPKETPNEIPAMTPETPRVPVGEWLQGAMMRVGQGRVAMFGEAGLFSGGPAADNRQFALNVLHWLTRQL